MYRTGIVYKIIGLENDVVYIGSSFNTPSQRWRNHLTKYKCWLNGKAGACSIFEHFKRDGTDKYRLVPIKQYKVCSEDVRDKKHLMMYETLWINKLKCINKQVAFQPISKKEQDKQYRQSNREQILEKKRQHYQNNREKVVEYNKQWYQDNREKRKERFRQYHRENREKLLEKRKEQYICECGSEVRIYHKSRHSKSKKHINWESNQPAEGKPRSD